MQPILFHFGSFHLSYHGLSYGLAILMVYLLAKQGLKQSNITLDDDSLLDLIILTFLAAVVGARVYYVFFNWEYYSSTKTAWYEFALLWHGGLAFHGGLFAGLIGFGFACKTQGLPLKRMADLFAPALFLGQAIGRVGNFMNGEVFGTPTSLPWGVVFRYGPAAHDYPGMALHPVNLYESLADLAGFGLLTWVGGKKLSPGFTSALYLFFYGVIRFTLSFGRVDELYLGGIKAVQLWSILLVIFSMALVFGLELYRKDEQPKKKEEKQFLPKRQWKL